MRLDETLGTDHYIVHLVIQHYKTPLKTGQAKITDWTTSLTYKTLKSGRSKSLAQWPNTPRVAKHTKTVKLSVDHPEVDPHLASPVGGQERPSKALEKAEKKPQASAPHCRFD
ncbi:hypothetical protein HPB50_005032 [Hyalomma asiaticum]|uniref:Uncharacterized protein n=1 Tax=Hyalomma asiaticum TaxID=266040 RepID=A0ACB7SJH2_HYAAI|nr:hypothetical protein HPB50_005032 [Hyalomma asiaticum]